MMKRLLTLLLALILCLGLAACGDSGTGAPATQTGDDAFDDLPISSMKNAETGVTVSLGMTREAIEDLLGQGVYYEPITPQPNYDSDNEFSPVYETVGTVQTYEDYHYGNGRNWLSVSYDKEDSLAVGFAASIFFEESADDSSNWCLKYGLTYGGSREDMFAHYGEKEALFPGAIAADDTALIYLERAADYYVYEYCFDETGAPMDSYPGCTYVAVISLDHQSGRLLSVSITDASGDQALDPFSLDQEDAPQDPDPLD